ncbi:hypothetical protein M2G70_07385 [Vibrio vulnificus]|nr:hypothetical protein [Vibrio vulnificus]
MKNEHPIKQQLKSWFSESLTIEEAKARLELVQSAINEFIESVQQEAPTTEPETKEE